MRKNVSVKLFSFINGGSIGDHERVCQSLQLHSMEGVLVIKNVSVKLVSFINGVGIGDEERACQTLLLIWRREYWWSRTYLSNSSPSSMEGVLVIKIVSVKLFSFINVGSIGDQERVCQTVKQNVSAKFYSFFNGGRICDEERVWQTLQFLQWRQYWWSRTCLSNSSVSSMEGVLVIKNMSVKLFCFFIGGSVGGEERVCQTLLLEGVLVIKNVSVNLFSFFNGRSIDDQERVSQTR